MLYAVDEKTGQDRAERVRARGRQLPASCGWASKGGIICPVQRALAKTMRDLLLRGLWCAAWCHHLLRTAGQSRTTKRGGMRKHGWSRLPLRDDLGIATRSAEVEFLIWPPQRDPLRTVLLLSGDLDVEALLSGIVRPVLTVWAKTRGMSPARARSNGLWITTVLSSMLIGMTRTGVASSWLVRSACLCRCSKQMALSDKLIGRRQHPTCGSIRLEGEHPGCAATVLQGPR